MKALAVRSPIHISLPFPPTPTSTWSISVHKGTLLGENQKPLEQPSNLASQLPSGLTDSAATSTHHLSSHLPCRLFSHRSTPAMASLRVLLKRPHLDSGSRLLYRLGRVTFSHNVRGLFHTSWRNIQNVVPRCGRSGQFHEQPIWPWLPEDANRPGFTGRGSSRETRTLRSRRPSTRPLRQ